MSVRASVMIALGLLGADVVHRADGLIADGSGSRAREKRAMPKSIILIDAVRQQHDVLRLDVAVNDALWSGRAAER